MNNLWGLIYVSKTPLLLNKRRLKNFNMLKIWASSLSNPKKGPHQAKNGKTSSFDTFTIHIVYLVK